MMDIETHTSIYLRDLLATPAALRTRRHGVPGVLGLRGAVARRGVQPLPRRGGLGARARSRTRGGRHRLPVPAAEEPVDPAAAGRQGTAEPRRHDAGLGRDGRLRRAPHDLGSGQRALDPDVVPPPDREHRTPRARQPAERDHQGRAPALRVLPRAGPAAARPQRLGAPSDTRWAMEHLWAIVGTGVRPQTETDFVVLELFGDERRPHRRARDGPHDRRSCPAWADARSSARARTQAQGAGRPRSPTARPGCGRGPRPERVTAPTARSGGGSCVPSAESMTSRPSVLRGARGSGRWSRSPSRRGPASRSATRASISSVGSEPSRASALEIEAAGSRSHDAKSPYLLGVGDRREPAVSFSTTSARGRSRSSASAARKRSSRASASSERSAGPRRPGRPSCDGGSPSRLFWPSSASQLKSISLRYRVPKQSSRYGERIDALLGEVRDAVDVLRRLGHLLPCPSAGTRRAPRSRRPGVRPPPPTGRSRPRGEGTCCRCRRCGCRSGRRGASSTSPSTRCAIRGTRRPTGSATVSARLGPAFFHSAKSSGWRLAGSTATS